MTNRIRRWTVAMACVICGLAGLSAGAAPAAPQAAPRPEKPAHPVYLTPEKAGPDYEVQGEYIGLAGNKIVGVQVIALGDGAFQAVIFPGGLPGGGWPGKVRYAVDGKRTGETTVFAPSKAKKRYLGKSPEEFSALKDNPADGQPNYTFLIRDGRLSGKTPDGGALAAKRVDRASPTLGAKPPAGATVLFDGTNVDQWVRGEMDARKLLAANAETKASFGSFRLHVEFLIPFKPTARGQERGNSGVYLQRRYEVQVLDSFGLEGAANECGGLYRQKPPTQNMAFPPLVWQTYDIEFTAAKFEGGKKVENARISVKHNGVTIHDDYALRNRTGAGRKEGPEPGPLWLQGHDNPVFYRNVWIAEKK